MNIRKLIKEEFDNIIINEDMNYLDLKTRNALKGLYEVISMKDSYRVSYDVKETRQDRKIKRAIAFLYKLTHYAKNYQISGIYYYLEDLFQNIKYDPESFFKEAEDSYKAIYEFYNDVCAGQVDNDSKYIQFMSDDFKKWFTRKWMPKHQDIDQENMPSGWTAHKNETVDSNLEQIKMEAEKWKTVNIDFYNEYDDWFPFSKRTYADESGDW